MPLSLILYLSPKSELPQEHLGRQAQAWFLKQIDALSPDYARQLHDSQGNKPYTISGVFGGSDQADDRKKRLKSAYPCFLRLTAFSPELEDLLLNQWLRRLPSTLRLWWVDLKVEGYTLDPSEHAWAGQQTYADLAGRSSFIRNSRLATFEFLTPTAFRSEGVDIPLPLPSHVFRSYWQKWNAFVPDVMRIDDSWVEFAADCIVVSGLNNVNTRRWKFADGAHGAVTGFTGRVGFTLLPKDQWARWEHAWDGADAILQTLAGFSFYCGTGHHTTIGLGQTIPRRVEQSPAAPAFLSQEDHADR